MPTKTRDSIQGLPVYSMGVQSTDKAERIIQLGQNELGVAASSAATEAVRQLAGELPRYPDMDHHNLRQAIAEVHELNADRIACGAGSMELMGLLATIFCEAGVEVVVSQYGYKFFQIQCSVAGAELVIIPEPEMCADIDAIAAAVNERTKIIFLVNPNNPTGATLPKNTLTRLRRTVPDNVLIILDGAYAEFANQEDYDHGLELVDSGENIAILRTFSKAYGLAGSRIGWLYAPDYVIQAIASIRSPNSITTQALAAAEAAMHDQSHLDNVVTEVIELRETLRTKILGLGLQVYPSGGNFLLVRFESEAQADNVFQQLLQTGIIVRPMGSYSLNDCLRISIGSKEEMGVFWERFKSISSWWRDL